MSNLYKIVFSWTFSKSKLTFFRRVILHLNFPWIFCSWRIFYRPFSTLEILDALSDWDDSDADPDYNSSSSSSSSEDEINCKGNKRSAPNMKAAPLAKNRPHAENLLVSAEPLPSTSSSESTLTLPRKG